ncbi:MAG: hypothetical protein ACLQPD_03485 [Desulfomonilaceae bacterium]
MNERIRIIIFFSLIFVWLFFLGRAGLPLAHEWLDPAAMRDTGTVFSYLVSRPDPLRSLVLASLQHVEGPLQFIILNLYCLAIGDKFPLNPLTMQFPNTIFAFLTCLFAFLLCKKLFSIRMAFYCAAAFALFPWLAHTIRLSEYWNTLSCLFHFSTFYFFACFMKESDSSFYKIAAPTSLMLYMLIFLDWPMYIFCLFVFFFLSGRFRAVLRNPYNAIPAIVILFMIIWAVALTIKFGQGGLRTSRLVYPFWRLWAETSKFSMERLWEHTLLPWGTEVLLAFGGLVAYALHFRKHLMSNRVGRSLLDSMCIWLVLATPPLMMSSGSPQYVYVLAMPTAALAAFALSNIRIHYGLAMVFIMLVVQVYLVTEGNFKFKMDEKRRILAAACFLIEQRPDLLAPEKTPFASGHDRWGEGGKAGAVTSYMRGPSKALVMPYEFPAARPGTSHIARFDAFVSAYKNEGKILADWIILGSEALSDKNPACDFFRSFLNDPNVRWIARFREENGEEIYIGEVTEAAGVPIEEAPLLDVKSLSDRYEAKYDRLSFLKNNVQYTWHY